MTQPGNINHILRSTHGHDWYAAKIRDLELAVRQLQTAQPIAIVSQNFDGTLEPASVGTAGYALTRSGDAIFNNLLLRGAIIGNDALANPLSPAIAHGDAQGFALTTTMHTVANATVTVPSGFTRALVTAVSTVSARNATGHQDFLAVGVQIGGAPTPGWSSVMDALGTATLNPVVTAASVGTALMTSLSGTITVSANASSGLAGWAADAYNVANIDASVLFLR